MMVATDRLVISPEILLELKIECGKSGIPLTESGTNGKTENTWQPCLLQHHDIS